MAAANEGAMALSDALPMQVLYSSGSTTADAPCTKPRGNGLRARLSYGMASFPPNCNVVVDFVVFSSRNRSYFVSDVHTNERHACISALGVHPPLLQFPFILERSFNTPSKGVLYITSSFLRQQTIVHHTVLAKPAFTSPRSSPPPSPRVCHGGWVFVAWQRRCKTSQFTS
ncbi:unnamed protein product [Ectocarpus sp. 4 AP-2014]